LCEINNNSVTNNKLDNDTGDEVYCVGNDDGILISNTNSVV